MFFNQIPLYTGNKTKTMCFLFSIFFFLPLLFAVIYFSSPSAFFQPFFSKINLCRTYEMGYLRLLARGEPGVKTTSIFRYAFELIVVLSEWRFHLFVNYFSHVCVRSCVPILPFVIVDGDEIFVSLNHEPGVAA